MLGYYLSESAYKKLAFDKNADFNALASKNIISLNEEDFDFTFTDEQKIAFANWFYNAYGNGIVELASQYAEDSNKQ